MTLMIVLGSSLFVALVINPMLTSVYMRVGAVVSNKKKSNRIALILIGIGLLFTLMHFGSDGEAGILWLANLLIISGVLTIVNVHFLTPAATKFQASFLPRLEAWYEGILTRALKGRRPGIFFASTFALLFSAFFLMGVIPPKVLFFPENEPQYLNVFIEKEIGTDIEVANQISRDIEAIVMDVMKEEDFMNPLALDTTSFLVSSIIGQVGNGTSDPAQGQRLVILQRRPESRSHL